MGWTTVVRFPEGTVLFLFAATFGQEPRHMQRPIHSREGQWPQPEAPYSAEVNSAWSYTATPPYVFTVWWLIAKTSSLVLPYFRFLSKIVAVTVLCSFFKVLSQLHGRYAVGGQPNLVTSNFIMTLGLYELKRWEQHLMQILEIIYDNRYQKNVRVLFKYTVLQNVKQNMAAVRKFSCSFQFDSNR